MLSEDYNRELDEAIMAGNRAISALTDAENYVASARNWGIFDMLGGGLISGLVKHSKMDSAQNCMQRAQWELQQFQKELSDVQMRCQVNINFDGLTKFCDLFCDNFLVDLLVQSRISDVRNNLAQAKQQVQNTVRQLQNMRRS